MAPLQSYLSISSEAEPSIGEKRLKKTFPIQTKRLYSLNKLTCDFGL